MTIFVKESEVVDINMIKAICSQNVSIRPFSTIEEVTRKDIIIISRFDSIIDELRDYHTVVFEGFLDNIYINLLQEYDNRHDFYYLKNALMQAKNENITTLITGSSYGAFGVDLNYIENTVNLSSISQDLYYSKALLREACISNKNIKKIVICVGYYFLYCDLSLNQRREELQRITKLYYPLLKDAHNCLLMLPLENIMFDSSVIDLNSMLNMYAENDYKKGFFNITRPRSKYANITWADSSKGWKDLTYEERELAGKERAKRHNSNIKNKATFYENVELLENLIHDCNETGKNILIAVMPATQQYLKYLNPKFKQTFYETLNDIDGSVHLIDFSDDTDFDECMDFIDMDHLNDDGARKFSIKLASILREL